ncbi:MAG: protein kinase [Planctomycetes bacterium]|nr:protein kinase [Planctomycetota bacterium]MCW8136983.1 protein kinase [Planctomycetota bacterium]
MDDNQQLDELFFDRAERRGLLTVGQSTALRIELARRRRKEPDLCAYELVVEKGWLSVEAALAVLEAHPDETLDELKQRLLYSAGSATVLPEASPFHRDTEKLSRPGLDPEPELAPEGELAPEDEVFSEVPKFVEPLAPNYAYADPGDTDSNLEMELPPPDSRSGDSLFEDRQTGEVEALPEPELIERTPSARMAQVKLDDLDHVDLDEEELIQAINADEGFQLEPESESIESTSLGMSATVAGDTLHGDKEDTSLGITGMRVGDTRSDTATGDSKRQPAAPAPTFAMRATKGASDDFASFGDEDELSPDMLDTYAPDESEVISQLMNDSAVNEVMEQADDSYFGPPADLTSTPEEVLHDSIAPPKPLDGQTLFDSEELTKGATASHRISTEQDDFVATAPPQSEAQEPISTLDSDLLVTVNTDFPTGEYTGGTIVDDSDVSLADLANDSEVTTGSHPSNASTGGRTHFQTGEGGRPGLRDRSESKLGVESNVTGDKLGDTIEAHEMTLADLRAQMGIGSGVKIGKHTSKLKKLAGSKRRYSVVREIARGGMGKVIEVEDNDLRRSVALKVLRKEMLDRRDLVERFLEEAQITGQLEHPNIVPVHEIGVDGRGNLYFTMKLVEGEDLSSILKRLRKKDPSAEKAFPVNRLVDIFIKVCEGVAFAHSKGVIHRDLKPANIMVGRFGEVQIMDWGVAKIVGRKEDTADRAVVSDRQDDDAARTMAGSILGTPSYMSPEQARGEVNTMGPESDIFSLGVILYELLALQTPWTAQTSAQVLDQVKNFNPEPPSVMNTERRVPAELEQLAMKCLAKQAHKRIASVAELIDNLRSWQEGRTLAAVEYSFGQLIAKWIKRNKVAVITSSLVLAALIGGSIFAWQAAQQAGIRRAEAAISEADGFLKEARTALGAENFGQARKLATDAAGKYQSALITLGDDERASTGLTQANTVNGEATVREETLRREGEERRRQQQLRKEFNESLAAAEALLTSAKRLESDGNTGLEKLSQAYADASNAFVQVRAIRVEGLEEEKLRVANAIAEIGAWMRDYEQRKQQEADMDRLRALVEAAEGKLVAAVAAKKYEDATRALIDTISTCDQAMAVSAPGDTGTRLRNRALDTKATAALNFATRAIDAQRLDVAELMLDTGAGTGRKAAEIDEARTTLRELVQKQSRFRQAMAAADEAVNDKRWTEAQTHIRTAINEAATSPFATPADRSRLDRMMQLARLEQLRARDTGATTGEQMEEVLLDYDELQPSLTDPDYAARARTYREELRRKLGATLMIEADAAQGDAARAELLEKAQRYITDPATLEGIRAQLRDIKTRLALAQVSEGQVLLPRGTFLLGSNRESDQNPQRQLEQSELLLIDKYPVTNEDFLKFVEAGGYERPELWHESARTMLSRFTDGTGRAGPAGWVEGGFDASFAKYPVTGICWFEAHAYATWKGKRLPTPDEWEVAAGAPRMGDINATDFPWGTRDKAPPAGVAHPREVGTAEWDANPTGARDMGSNVAEWTSGLSEETAVAKGAEPGLRAELWFRYARRAKISVAPLLDRSAGRGFRCIETFTLDSKDKDGDGE